MVRKRRLPYQPGNGFKGRVLSRPQEAEKRHFNRREVNTLAAQFMQGDLLVVRIARGDGVCSQENLKPRV